MRLIDADELYEDLANSLSWIMGDGQDGENIDTYSAIGENIKDVLDKQPIAYCVDKVVNELKDIAIEFEAFGQCSDYVELTHAIEIVKAGGIDNGN